MRNLKNINFRTTIKAIICLEASLAASQLHKEIGINQKAPIEFFNMIQQVVQLKLREYSGFSFKLHQKPKDPGPVFDHKLCMIFLYSQEIKVTLKLFFRHSTIEKILIHRNLGIQANCPTLQDSFVKETLNMWCTGVKNELSKYQIETGTILPISMRGFDNCYRNLVAKGGSDNIAWGLKSENNLYLTGQADIVIHDDSILPILKKIRQPEIEDSEAKKVGVL